MPAPRRKLQETFAEAHTPPELLTSTQKITRIVKGEGNNLFLVQPAEGGEPLLVELQPRFRSSLWLRRGGFVLVDTDRAALGERENKIRGEIVNVVLDEKEWRKMGYWPAEFANKGKHVDDADMPRYDDSNDEDTDVQT